MFIALNFIIPIFGNSPTEISSNFGSRFINQNAVPHSVIFFFFLKDTKSETVETFGNRDWLGQ